MNSGLNEHGLALQKSQSGRRAPTPEREELRTALNAEVLARCTTVEQAVEELENHAREHPAMLGGNVMLGDSRSISVTEYFGGNAQSEILEEGVLIPANHSVFGLVENKSEDSENRYDEMAEFSKALYSAGRHSSRLMSWTIWIWGMPSEKPRPVSEPLHCFGRVPEVRSLS